MQEIINATVIIPTYQSWNLLEKCLSALQKQTFESNYEIIVVNNDIDDSIPENFKKFEQVRFIQEIKPGSYAARNKGIIEAKGEIIAFTDADCIPDKNWLENGVRALIENPEIGVVAGDVKLFYKDENNLDPVETYDKNTAFKIKEYVSFGNCVTANWFSYKDTLLKFGMFDQNLKSGGDSKLSQIISSQMPLIFQENAIVYHPARNKMTQIKTKYRRIFGGRYINKYQNRKLAFINHTIDFIYRRLKFNLNFLFKGKYKDFFHVSYVHIFLLPHLLFESFKIILTNKTERR